MLRLAVLSSLLFCLVNCSLPDQHQNCEGWAEAGECDKNPGYMLSNCATSCDRVAAVALQDANELEGIDSFFDLSANDINGKVMEFSQLRGDVTVVVNVASYCGYTDSHYKGLVQLWSHVKRSGRVHILAFPCNQFGGQEPESNESIQSFAANYGVEFTMMEKIDVNGPNASIVYKYLKHEAGPKFISWNFATYFVIGPGGKIESHSGVEPMDLKDATLELARSAEEL